MTLFGIQVDITVSKTGLHNVLRPIIRPCIISSAAHGCSRDISLLKREASSPDWRHGLITWKTNKQINMF